MIEGWAQGGISLLAASVSDGITKMAQVLAEENLLTVTSPRQRRKGYLLEPVSPTNKRCPFSCDIVGVGNYGYHQSGSLQPTFEWQSFTEAYADDPLYPDIDAADLDISYDLRIYEARPFGFGAQFIPNADTSELFLLSTGDMEYEFYGISDTRFTPQIELEPCKPYTWTVRARFIADGKTHLTHWSGNYDEDEIEEYRERLTSESGGARMGRAISGFMGIDQQEYYRENAYYFPFLATPAAADCGDRLIREAIGR